MFIIVSIVFLIVGCLLIIYVGKIIILGLPITLTYLGLWISIYGVILTLVQVMKLKKITEATEEAIKTTRKQVNLILSVSDTAKHVANIRFIKEYITNDKVEMARLRLSDVKDFMSRIGYITDLEYDKNKYKKLINTLEANLNSLELDINRSQKLDKNIICTELEKVASFLTDIENNLKSK